MNLRSPSRGEGLGAGGEATAEGGKARQWGLGFTTSAESLA